MIALKSLQCVLGCGPEMSVRRQGVAMPIGAAERIELSLQFEDRGSVIASP